LAAERRELLNSPAGADQFLSASTAVGAIATAAAAMAN